MGSQFCSGRHPDKVCPLSVISEFASVDFVELLAGVTRPSGQMPVSHIQSNLGTSRRKNVPGTVTSPIGRKASSSSLIGWLPLTSGY